jgi:TM2 domain-containing membrane protein YozV
MRNTGVAYLLWALCFIGVCGAHRFYLDSPLLGIGYFVTGGVCLVGQIIDLFLIPGMVEDCNRRFREQNKELTP